MYEIEDIVRGAFGQEYEVVDTYKCGCAFAEIFEGSGDQFKWLRCPLHAAAPKMLEALEKVTTGGCDIDERGMESGYVIQEKAMDMAHVALAAAKRQDAQG